MDEQNITTFLATKAQYFGEDKIGIIRAQLEKIDDNKFLAITSMQYKNPTTALILAILLPGFDRIFLGQVGLGILKLLTCSGLAVWWIIDMIGISKATKELNFQKFSQIAN